MHVSSSFKKWGLIALGVIVVIYFVLTGLIPTASIATAQAATVYTSPTQITASSPVANIQATVSAPTMSQAVAQRLLDVGQPYARETWAAAPATLSGIPSGATTTGTVHPAGAAPSTSAYASKIVSGNSTTGCAGTVVRTKKVYIFVSVVLAWRRVIQAGWCWNSARITSVGGHYHDKWGASGYCWSNESFTNIGWVGSTGNWREFRLNDHGSLHVRVPFVGCNTAPLVDSFRFLNPTIYYHRGGSYNFGT